jgi:hypothetical protein
MPRNPSHAPIHAPTHAVVWLDFHQAKIFLITAEDVDARRIKADTPHRRIHHKAQVRGSGHVRDDGPISRPSWPLSRRLIPG